MFVALVVGTDQNSTSAPEACEPPLVSARAVVVHDRGGMGTLVPTAACFQGDQGGGTGSDSLSGVPPD
ncbi:hypothetical protein [Nocardiopsis listeri]|uniref:hypothetical protein n=1 Tax=Nocardiopsis listeri TaxID=53440 RepID=UPI00083580F0|nr:hypothetical protein [Nocardiopsis listeri]